MDEQAVLQVLGKVGAVITDSHVVYTSGKHGTAYVNKDAIYPHTAETSRLCRAIAERFADDSVETVIAPAVGGVVLSQWTAHHLTELTGREVFGVYAEKLEMSLISVDKRNYLQVELTERRRYDEDFNLLGIVELHSGEQLVKRAGTFTIGRGYDKFISGKNVLVVEDVLTTGSTAKKVVEAVRTAGGNIVGLGVLCNRGGITTRDVGDVPKLVTLVNVKLDAWDEKDCPLCRQGVPVNTDVGKGREFLARQSQLK